MTTVPTTRLLFPLWFLALPMAIAAEDVVVTRGAESGKTLKRKGTIVEWKGDSLILATGTGQRRIANDEIVQVQTAWQEDYLAGKADLEQFRFDDAIARLEAAYSAENRPWARQLIQARLVEAYQGAQQPLKAIEQFLSLTREDPQTRFFNLIPLAWSNESLNAQPVVAAVRPLADSQDVIAQLIAASWLLNDSRDPNSRGRATELLEQLSGDIEPRIAVLAGSQLWRSQVVTADEKVIARWKSRVDGMDPELRFGGRWLIAEALARQQEPSRAAVQYLTIPILHSSQHGLVPLALYKAGSILQNEGDSSGARKIWQELGSKYPNSQWARQANSADGRGPGNR